MNHNFARQRYEIIDECLTNRFRKWDIHSLLDKVNDFLIEELGTNGIKERQLRNDLSVMKSEPPHGFDAPIVCDRATGHYSYSDADYTISKSPLAETDVEKLNEALVILKQFESLPQFQDMKDVILKLESKGGRKAKEIGNIISFDNQKNVVGTQWLDFLYRSIIEKRVLLIDYKPFTKEKAKELEIHPYFLKEFNSRWFLFGKQVPDEKKYPVVILALDRMQFIRVGSNDFIPNTETDFERYFDNIIGVSLDVKAKKENVRLEFPAQRANYIITKPLHKSQMIVKESKEKLVVEISVIPNKELFALLKSYGKDVKVLSPKSILDELKSDLKTALHQYR